MKTVCQDNQCTGCMACVNVCPKEAIKIIDNIESFNAGIDQAKCINCNLCYKVCPNIANCKLQKPIYWKQGWAVDEIRRKSSSGGAASAMIYAFIKDGGYVASCLFEDGKFGFILTNDKIKAQRFAGSKYVKSNPEKIYQGIKRYLTFGEKVLFIGLPCQSAAVQNFCGKSDNLYTIDLICHGTPSPKLLKQFVTEQGTRWENISDIRFRENGYFGLDRDGVRFTPRRVMDSYTRAFLGGVDYTENCYSCRYATIYRVSDITLGDSWGQKSDTVLGGVSLIMCQTPKGVELLEKAKLHLEEVDIEKVIEANHQLRYPSNKHAGRKKFLSEIKAGHSFRWAIIKAMPKESIKQSIKHGMIKIHLMKDFLPNSDTK